MNRGARRQPIFLDDLACGTFVELLSHLPARFQIRVHAYALMPNHYHLLLESVRPNLSRAMAWLGAGYAQYLNHRFVWDGPVFKDRFHSKPVYDDTHLHHLPIYLHLNPLRAKLVNKVDQSHWTSHSAYAGLVKRPYWLTTSELMAGYGSKRGYRQYLEEVRLGRSEPPDDFEKVLFQPWSKRQTAANKGSRKRTKKPSVSKVLKAVATANEQKKTDMIKSIRGRKGNLGRKMAAYWLVMGAGLKNVEAARVLDMHPVRISTALREISTLRADDPDIRILMSKIEKMVNC